ncbi:LysR family transcriptional regulator [Microbacterium sp.]|uniref:LysR family transcriptional regulator n=1 Tax=Microbacterium sp. TaxID=51671 RepID=UPI003A83DD1C
MLLTQLEYFVALARERHFGRAASSVHITQSALSESIRKLETELGAALVNRGRTFEGLTPEGERVLVWARKMVDDHRALIDEVHAKPQELSGEARIGVIPSAIAEAADLVTDLAAGHPLLTVRCDTGLTSEEIIEQIRRFELDAGLVHPSVNGGDGVTITPVSEEPLVVVAHENLFPADSTTVPARTLATMPVCLLREGMRGRQVLDSRLAEHGVELHPRVQTDSVEELVALAHTGSWAAVVPANATRDQPPGIRALPLTDPAVTLAIAVATRLEQPQPALSRAILRAASTRPRTRRG